MAALSTVRKALASVEKAAKDQPWAKERPWRARTHVVDEGGVVVVDLHDLKANLAKRAVQLVVERGPPEAGALVFVVGRGRNSVGPGGVLGKVVRSELGGVCAKQAGWSVRMVGPARVAWITDRRKAPKHVLGGGGVGITLLWLALIAAFLFAIANTLGLLS